MTREEKIRTQRQEIKKLLQFFKNNKLDRSNEQAMNMIQDAIIRVFQLEVEELGYKFDLRDPTHNTFKLHFINDANDNTRGEQIQPKKITENGVELLTPEITFNKYTMYKGLDSENVNTRIHTCKLLFNTVFHEIQHQRQELMAQKNYSSKEAITYGKEFALMYLLDNKFYSQNYNFFAIENNANETSYREYQSIMGYDINENNLRIFQEGKLNTGRFYAENISSKDGKSSFDYDLAERDDIATIILDNIICQNHNLNALRIYPILQKEYNLDGTKKTAYELIQNMMLEQNEITNNNSLNDEERKTAIKDGQEMYYELIYKALERSSQEQLFEISEQIGENKYKEILDNIQYYFQNQMENRIGKATQMANIKKKNDKIVFPSNDGTIIVERDGKKVPVSLDEFISTLNPELLQKKFIHPKLKSEHTAEKFLRKVGLKYIDKSGQMTLKDGTVLSAKDYVEQYMLGQMERFTENYTVRDLITDTVQLDNESWKEQKETKQRLINYYGDKKRFISDVSNLISNKKQDLLQKRGVENSNKQQEDLLKQNSIERKKLSPEQMQRKMKWIREFISNYDATENEQQYDYRTIYENDNTLLVVDAIKNGDFVGKGLSEIDLDYFPNDKEFSIQRAIPKIARLLKVADNLTIDGGRNYLEEFANIPNVNEILLQIKKSQSVKEMFAEAKENIQTGNVPHYKKTTAEIDKHYAQQYLSSDNITRESVEDEIRYRRDLTQRERLKISNETDKKSIPMLRKQQISLSRVLARQDGKVPSEAIYDENRKGWYCITDTKKK